MKHYDTSRFSLFGSWGGGGWVAGEHICLQVACLLAGVKDFLTAHLLSPSSSWVSCAADHLPKSLRAEAEGQQLGEDATVLNWTLLFSGGGGVYFFVLQKSKEA